MVKVVLIDKNCNKKETVLNYDVGEFYKKCNYRINNNFEVRHTWEFKIRGEQIVKINMIYHLLLIANFIMEHY